MKLEQGKKYKIQYNNFLNNDMYDTVEYDGAITENIKHMICDMCGKKFHTKLHRFHSLTAIHTWYYFGTSCVNKIEIER